MPGSSDDQLKILAHQIRTIEDSTQKSLKILKKKNGLLKMILRKIIAKIVVLMMQTLKLLRIRVVISVMKPKSVTDEALSQALETLVDDNAKEWMYLNSIPDPKVEDYIVPFQETQEICTITFMMN